MARPRAAPPTSPFAVPVSSRVRVARACATIVAGSLLTLIPIVATVPWLPPAGLLLLLAWRLRDPRLLPAWAPLPLGLFDDLVSGQVFGSAMVLWTVVFIAIDVLDSRLVWRFFAHDWLIAAGAAAGVLTLQRLLAAPLAAHVDTLLLIQIAVAAALFPLAALIASRIDVRVRP